ncbi:unnamed protein product [Heterobilharzia americana]|nr:unnamed protein product [Heterobilharzia americana]
MPTPHLSRAPSGPSPKYATGDELCDTTCPIDWDTNVVNFISTCLHPGLVRRTSSSAVGHGFDKPYHFRRQHRRNFSTATAAGYTKYPDIQNASSRLPYSNAFNHSNDYQVAPTYYKRVLGHTRNISDPTSGWDFRVVNKPLTLDQLTERPSFNWDGFDGQHPVVSSENQHTLPDASAIHEIKAENYPCLKPSPPSNDVIESSLMCTGDMEISQTRNSECDVDDNTGACLSPCFRSCANPCVVLVGLCLTMFMQTMVVSGLMSSMFTTLEKRFNLTSRQIGYMISCYEIAGVVTTVVVSFINGQKHNRLRVIGLATLILALGFGLFALPHFLAGPYRPSLFSYDTTAVENDSLLHSSHAPPYHLHSNQDPTDQMTGPICIHQTHNTVASHEVIQTSFADETNVDASVIRAVSLTTTNHVNNINSNSTNGLSNMESIISNDIVTSVLFPTFCIAMLLAGIGASPLYVLAPTYLWDNLTDRQYPIYAALFYSAGGLGPACGFLAGAGFLSIYIDSPFMLPQSGVDRNSPLWLGAWWLGMLVCAALTFMVALPVICFPKRLTVKKNVSVTQLGGYGDVDETSPSTAQCANHNIYNDNNTTEPSNNSNINLSYIKSPNGLPDTSEQIQKTTKMTATTTCVTTPSTCQGQPACRTTVKYPSLDEFKQQQQRQPPPLQQPSTVVQDSIGFHNTITTSTVNTTTPFPTDTLINVGTNVAIPSNHYYLHSKDYYNDVAKGDGCVAATMEQLNDINNDNGDLRMSAKKSLRNSFHKSRTKLRKKIKALILILRRVLTNPVWLGVTLSTVVEQSIVAAFLTFAAKYIQILFHVPAYLASIHTGAVIVPSSLLGVLSGALLMRHFRPTLHRTLFGLCIMIAITVVTSISLMSIGCHSSRMAGITATYDGKRWPWRSGPGF